MTHVHFSRRCPWLARAVVLAAAVLPLLAIGGTAAAEPSIVAPTEPVPIGGFADVTIKGLSDPNSLAWVTVPEIPVRVYAVWGTGEPILSVPTNASGTWTLVVAYVEGGKPVLKKIVLVIGTGPTPPTPNPVDPPVPPGPSGLRVLILRETQDTDSQAELEVLMSTKLRDYLNSHAAKGADGKTPEWRMWDDDYTSESLNDVTTHWKEAYAAAKAAAGDKVPWLYVSNGREGFSGPLPATVDATLTLLKKYGGE